MNFSYKLAIPSACSYRSSRDETALHLFRAYNFFPCDYYASVALYELGKKAEDLGYFSSGKVPVLRDKFTTPSITKGLYAAIRNDMREHEIGTHCVIGEKSQYPSEEIYQQQLAGTARASSRKKESPH